MIEVPALESIWRHKKGVLYRVTKIVNNNGQSRREEYPIIICYEDKEGKEWGRNIDRWYGSMIQLTSIEKLEYYARRRLDLQQKIKKAVDKNSELLLALDIVDKNLALGGAFKGNDHECDG